jgi:DNA-binding transcriptional regulator LsrR (DeoR family)
MKLVNVQQVAAARALYDGEQTALDTICATLGISRATLSHYLKPSRA